MTTPAFFEGFFLYSPPETAIRALEGRVDGYLSEEHEANVAHTTYPVESGASLTDHALRRPNKLKLEGWVSDLLPSDTAILSLPLAQRAPAAWREIDRLMNARQPLMVVTGLKVYRNMLLTKASAPVNSSTGLGLRFTLELEEVLFRPLREVVGGLTLVPAPTGPAAERTASVNRGQVETRPLAILEAEAITRRVPNPRPLAILEAEARQATA